MNNFTLHLPTKVLFGKGQIAEIKNQIPTGAKILMTYGGGSIKRNGVYDQVLDALKGFEIVEFSGIEPNPQFSTLIKEKLVQFAQRVWGYQDNDSEQAIRVAIDKTRAFFEQMGTPTRLSAYGIDDSQFPSVLNKLKEHKTENLGEHKNIDIKAAEEILRLAL